MAESITGSSQQPSTAAIAGISNTKNSTVTLTAQQVPDPLAHQWVVIGSAASAPTTVGGLDGGHTAVSLNLVSALPTQNNRKSSGTWTVNGVINFPSGLAGNGGVVGHTAYVALATDTTTPVDATTLDVVASLGPVSA